MRLGIPFLLPNWMLEACDAVHTPMLTILDSNITHETKAIGTMSLIVAVLTGMNDAVFA